MSGLDILVLAGLTLLGVAFAAWLLWDGFRTSMAQPFDVVFEDGENDDKTAVSKFVEVLRHAHYKLIVHDDGNDMRGSIYNNDEVVEAVKRQLDSNPELVIMCLFNVQETLKLVEELGGHDRFRVKYRRQWPQRPAFDVHYKIADNGAIGHLSHHDFGAEERRFEMRNCLKTGQTERNIEFGKYMRRFTRQFWVAKAA